MVIQILMKTFMLVSWVIVFNFKSLCKVKHLYYKYARPVLTHNGRCGLALGGGMKKSYRVSKEKYRGNYVDRYTIIT